MESQVGDGFVDEYLCSLQKCVEMLVSMKKKMAKLDSHFKHSKFETLKVASMEIETSETFFNASDTTSRQREMCRIKKDYRKIGVFSDSELEHLNQRLKILEEDMERMKQALLWHVKEKRRLVNTIYNYFQCMQHMIWHRNEVKGEQVCHKKLIIKKTPKDCQETKTCCSRFYCPRI